ncbi:unnamed protein product [Caenorhabditis sp. 36 PRJEB53466]|nr:unnamed protein product [Caenorhabditis sp. 36 PRJEB53466]
MAKLLLLLSATFLTVTATENPFGSDDCQEGEPKCPPGYKFFERADDRAWCLKYFAGNYTFFEAEQVCRCQGGATLSGVDNTNELLWIEDQATQSFEQLGIKNGGVWVGAYRRHDCMGPVEKWINKTECSKVYQFQWTDRNTVKTYMWEKMWMEGSPHNNIVGNHSENCVQLQISLEEQGTANRKLHGTFDNRICVHRNESSTFHTEGFVCGRPPKYPGGGHGYSGGDGQILIIGAGKPTKKP